MNRDCKDTTFFLTSKIFLIFSYRLDKDIPVFDSVEFTLELDASTAGFEIEQLQNCDTVEDILRGVAVADQLNCVPFTILLLRPDRGLV